MSVLQPKKQCGRRADCYLCNGKLGAKHTHPVSWSTETKKFLSDVSDETAEADCVNVCVCKACFTDIRRGMQNSSEQAYCQRWEKSRCKVICCIPGCSEDGQVSKHSFSWADIRVC